MSAQDYRVGDVIVYTPLMGGDRYVVVTERYDDVKNGRAGFDGHVVDHPDMPVWGYDAQITCILPASPPLPNLVGLAREATTCVHCHRPIAKGAQAFVTAWNAPFAAACPGCWRDVDVPA
jgi:hypothetical protein